MANHRVERLGGEVRREVADILDTYIYRYTIGTGQRPGEGAAIGLFKSVVSFILVILVVFILLILLFFE